MLTNQLSYSKSCRAMNASTRKRRKRAAPQEQHLRSCSGPSLRCGSVVEQPPSLCKVLSSVPNLQGSPLEGGFRVYCAALCWLWELLHDSEGPVSLREAVTDYLSLKEHYMELGLTPSKPPFLNRVSFTSKHDP